tara:strand:- start:46485 stop:48323 length:1839 start_codon:yes stop_codon:yes gene_type:complete
MSEALKNYNRANQTQQRSTHLIKKSVNKMLVILLLCVVSSNVLGFLLINAPRERYFLTESGLAEFDTLEHRAMPSFAAAQGAREDIITYHEGDGETVDVDANALLRYGHKNQVYRHILKQCLWTSMFGVLLALIINAVLWVWLVSKGKKLSRQKHLRGGKFESSKHVSEALKKTKRASDFMIANVPLVIGSEVQHTMITGSTGTGKTVCMSSLLSQIRAKKQRAVVYDKMGTYTQWFAREGKDIILNPLDERFPGWHTWGECRMASDYDRMAESMISMQGSGHDPFWIQAARIMFSVANRKLKGQCKTSQLLSYLLKADLSHIKDIFANTEAESLVSEDAAKMALSVKAVLSVSLRSMLYLDDVKNPFSIRQWVEEDKDDSWIFITSREDQHATLAPLIASWIDVASNAMLSLPPDDKRRIHLVLDEVGSLPRLPSLPGFMAQARQFGGCTWLGLQTLSQFHKNFGREGTEEILGVCNTGIHLRSPDEMTAKYISESLGVEEIEETSESVSYGARDAISVNEHKRERRIILPTEIQRLEDLQAYVRLKGAMPITKVKFKYKNHPKIASRYIPREINVDRKIADVIKPFPDAKPVTEKDNAEIKKSALFNLDI